MVKSTFTSTAALFTLFGASACAASPDILSHGSHKRHHALSERFGLLEELGLAPVLQDRDAPTPPSVGKRSPSLASSSNLKRDDNTAMYKLLGCVPETTAAGQPILANQVSWDATTMQSCVQACVAATSTPYLFAGIIRGNACFCDGTDVQSYNAIMNNITTIDQSNCKATCENGSEKWCGGASAYQVYYLPTSTPATTDPTSETPATVAESVVSSTPSTSSVPSATPSTVSIPEGVNYAPVACYNDGIDSASRILRGAILLDSATLTPSECVNFCYQTGYPFAGVENGSECYCGTTAFVDPAATTEGCATPCIGDSSQLCGAASQITIYSITDASALTIPTPVLSTSNQWSHKGCLVDDTVTRALPFSQAIDTSTFSVENCAIACANSGYNFAGVEYGSECYCGSTPPDSSLVADPQDCDIPCANGGGTCGGLLRFDLYSA